MEDPSRILFAINDKSSYAIPLLADRIGFEPFIQTRPHQRAMRIAPRLRSEPNIEIVFRQDHWHTVMNLAHHYICRTSDSENVRIPFGSILSLYAQSPASSIAAPFLRRMI